MRTYLNAGQASIAQSNADAVLHTPGVNVFGQCVRVNPGFERTYDSGLVFNWCRFQGEFGYNFFARSAECVKLKCPWKITSQFSPAFVAYPTNPSTPDVTISSPGDTDSVQMINTIFSNPTFGDVPNEPNIENVDNYNSSVIHACDLDLNSAAHPSMATHTIYGSAGWHFESCDFPLFVGIGGSWEYSRDNTGLDRWAAWGKFGMSF